MTQTRNILAGLALLIIGLIGGAALAQTIDAITVQPSATAEIEMTRIDAIPAAQYAGEPTNQGQALDALGGTEALTAEQRGQIALTVDRICEGLAADVPVMEMADALVRDQGLTDEQARDMVNEVAVERCATR